MQHFHTCTVRIWVLCIVSMCCAVACAPKRGMPSRSSDATEAERPVASGIEGMRWVIRDNPRPMQTTIESMQVSGMLRPCNLESLRTLGFLAFVLDEAQLDALLHEWGGTPALERVWFGHVSSWKSVATTTVSAERLISIDGRAVSGFARLYELEFRGWTLPTLDGSAATLEFRALVDSPTLAGLPTRRGEDASVRGRLLAAPRTLALQRNEALVLFANPALSLSPDTGPDAAPLPTPADVLLNNRAFPDRREVLVFIPRFADTLPQPLRDAATVPPLEPTAPDAPRSSP